MSADDPVVRFVQRRGEVQAEDVARYLKVTKPTARERLKRLVDAGWISRFTRYRPGESGRGSTWYKVAPSRRMQLGQSNRARWAARPAASRG